MARGRPWYKRDPERWIMGTRGLSLEERGAYSEIVDYLNLRDHAIPDDVKIIATLLHIPPQRWRKIRAVLLKAKKIEIQGDYLTNARFEREKAARDLARTEAVIHGREGGLRSAEQRSQSELDFEQRLNPDSTKPQKSAKPEQGLPQGYPLTGKTAPKQPEDSKNLQLSSKKVATKLEVPKEHLTPVSQKTATRIEGYPQAPCAGAREQEEDKNNTLPDSSLTTSREIGGDLYTKFEAVCDAAGFKPVSPAAIDRAMRTVEAWVTEEIDFELVVLPTIRSIIAESTDGPTRVLSRFTAHIANEQAKAKAKLSQGRTYSPPVSPILNRPDEEPEMAELRTILCQLLGPKPFSAYLNNAKLERDGTVLRVTGPMISNYTGDKPWIVLTQVAKRHGFTKVWA